MKYNSELILAPKIEVNLNNNNESMATKNEPLPVRSKNVRQHSTSPGELVNPNPAKRRRTNSSNTNGVTLNTFNR